jgi:hypothetical protein
VPAAQGVGAALPAGQKLPGGHAPSTPAVPLPRQRLPAGHALHCCALRSIRAVEKVPSGHAQTALYFCEVSSGQVESAEARKTRRLPAAGAASPLPVGQKKPPGHGCGAFGPPLPAAQK